MHTTSISMPLTITVADITIGISELEAAIDDVLDRSDNLPVGPAVQITVFHGLRLDYGYAFAAAYPAWIQHRRQASGLYTRVAA